MRDTFDSGYEIRLIFTRSMTARGRSRRYALLIERRLCELH